MAPPSDPRGNALFIILIAVALFAALSYAVTQSGRGGAGADRERSVIAAAQILQYGTSVRTAVDRLLLTGTSVADLQLCPTADGDQFCTGAAEMCSTGTDCVFAPEGGGISYQDVPSSAQAAPASWAVHHENAAVPVAVQGVGTASADVVMWVNPLTQTACEAINRGLGLSVPVAADADGILNGLTAYSGEPFFCFEGGGAYWYVHTLVER